MLHKFSLFKNIHFNKVFVIAFCFTLLSCNPRQARVVNKVINEIDHATEERTNSDIESQPQETNTSEQKYAVTGISFSSNFVESSRLEEKYTYAIENSDGLHLEHLGVTYLVYENDRDTYETMPTLRDIPVNGEDAPDRIYHDVSKYDFVAHTDNETIFFNISRKIN